MNKIKKLFLVLLFLELLLSYAPAFAQNQNNVYDYSKSGVEAEITKYLCTPKTVAPSSNDYLKGTLDPLSSYQKTAAFGNTNSGVLYQCINQIYKFAIVVAAVIGVFFIVIAGYIYMSAEGNTESTNKAKDILVTTVTSLVILMGGYVLLKAINPDLIQFHNVQPPSISLNKLSTLQAPATTTNTTTNSTSTGSCNITAFTQITNPDALNMENGQKVVWTSQDPNIQSNLTKLQTEFNKLKSVYPSATVNSAYRPLEYQSHLYEIYQKAKQLQNDPSLNSNSDCSAIIKQLTQEEQKHGVCNGDGPCLVAAPTACAPHTKGTGIDIGGISDYNSVNFTLQQKGINLNWQGLSNDPVHFNLQNPPYSGCGQ